MYWTEELVEKIEQAIDERGVKEPVVFNAGLSVSGLQHVGRLRGELLIGSTIRKILKEKGYQTKQYLTLYTQDEWKGKEPQLKQFPTREKGQKYRKWPLVEVPDPKGECHDGWVEHFWEPFGDYLKHFVKDITTITTTRLYKEKMKPYVKKAIEEKEKIAEILNKYREEELPPDWDIFSPKCEECGKIGDAIEVTVSPETYKAEYKCRCGNEGVIGIGQGKLAWRVEWAAIWSALNVDFEPYGKDHAAPGGSRDTANEISMKVLDTPPPIGTAYEWVAYREDEETNVMSSSDFRGFTPKTWIELAEPEILNFLYLIRKPMKQITLDLQRIPHYAKRFRLGEKIFFNKEKEREEGLLKNAYKYAFTDAPPRKFPFRLSYSHAALFVQTIPENMDLKGIIKRLRQQDILEKELSGWEKNQLRNRLHRARNWVKHWAPARYQISLIDRKGLSSLAAELSSLLEEQENVLKELLSSFKHIQWSKKAIKERMATLISSLSSNATRNFFQGLYLAFLGKKKGPRIARYFSLLEQDTVTNRLAELIEILERKS